MNILITGGAGFIGSNFIIYWLKKYARDNIINLDALTYAGNLANLNSVANLPNYRFIKGNICNSRLVSNIIRDIDIIVHFAAESHVDRSIQNSHIFVKTNVIGTQVLLEAARRNGNKRLHHISTDEVFGSLGKTGKFNENTIYNPSSPYSASKAASDHLVRAYFRTHKLPITISNCTNNYGPCQFPEKVIPLFVTNLMEGKKVPLYGTGLNIRDWIHVDNHSEAIDVIIHSGKIGETYCVGGDCEKTNIEITNFILDHFGKGKEMIEFVPDRKGHDFRYSMDISKIKRELGWYPKHTFEEGLRKTIEWYKNNEKWWQKLKERTN